MERDGAERLGPRHHGSRVIDPEAERADRGTVVEVGRAGEAVRLAVDDEIDAVL